MKDKAQRILFFIILAAGLTSNSFAQAGQTGALKGAVTDTEGQVLPGVSVTIKSSAILLPQMSALTNEQGIYRFPSLPPGVYEVTFELEGLSTLIRQGIKISAGQTTTLNVTLEFKAIKESVTVTGKAPTIDIQSTAKNIILEKEILHSIPTARNLDGYFNLGPGIVAEDYPIGPMSSSHGSGIRDNAFNLDGVNISDPVFGSQIAEFGTDAMEEISIQSGGLAAEYGDSMGTFVNVITKSGGNSFSGSASVYYLSENFQSTNTRGTPLEGSTSGYKYTLEPVVTFGGPLVKDRLWFFTNLSLRRSRQLVPGYPYGAGEGISPDESRLFPFAKLTFQPDQANRFTLSYNYSDMRRNHSGASQFNTESSTAKFEQPSHVFNAQWTRTFSANFFANFKIGYINTEVNWRPKTTQPVISDLATNVSSGSYGILQLKTHTRFQFNTDGTVFKDDLAGSHEFKFGGELQVANAHDVYEYMKDPLNDMSFIFTYSGIPLLGYWVSGVDKKEATINAFVFLQDSWSPSRRLTLNLGVRFAHQRARIPQQNEDEGPIDLLGFTFDRSVPQAFNPMIKTTLSPRLGFIYDLTGDGKTLFKASFSRYIQPNVQQYFWAANPNGPYAYLQLLSPDGTPIPDAYLGVIYPTAAKTSYGDHKAKAPRSDELTISLERELFENFSLGIRYIKKWDRNLLETVDANQLDLDELMNNGNLVWTNWEQVVATDPYDGGQVTFWNQKEILPIDLYLLNTPGAERNYDSVEVTVGKRFSDGWSLVGSYVWQYARGLVGTSFLESWGQQPLFDNPNAHVNAYGEFMLERPHQFKLLGMVQGPWGINISGFFRVFSGMRYTRTVGNLDLGVALNQGVETIYAEKQGSRGLPFQTILDLRLEKVFRFRGFSFSAFVDGFNIFNGNKAIEVITTSSSPALTFEEMTAIQNPRVFRLGAKLEF